MSDRPKVLVKEKIADTGVDLLKEQFDVDLGLEMSDEELAEQIGNYDAILIRSATKLTPELIARADNMKVIGRAGIGVDRIERPQPQHMPGIGGVGIAHPGFDLGHRQAARPGGDRRARRRRRRCR